MPKDSRRIVGSVAPPGLRFLTFTRIAGLAFLTVLCVFAPPR